MKEFVISENKTFTAMEYNPIVGKCFFFCPTSMGNKAIKTVKVGISCCGGYFGSSVVDFRRDAIRDFSKDVKRLYDTLNGTAVLKSNGGKTHITFQACWNGHIKIYGELAYSEQEEEYPLMLSFVEDFDQTMLKGFAETLYQEYGNNN